MKMTPVQSLICKTSDTSSFGTFSVSDAKALALLHNDTYTLASPGPVPDRQEAPHLHDAVLDPTKKFIVVPDLGSDLVRVYKIGPSPGTVTPVAPVKAIAGSGPRHAAFAVQGPNTYLYTVNELSNTITGYAVSYKGETPEFTQILDVSTHGPGGSVPKGTKSAEIVVSVSSLYSRSSETRKYYLTWTRNSLISTLSLFLHAGKIP